MINLNVIKKAMFLPVKDKKLSLSNSAPQQNVELLLYVRPQGRVYLKCMLIPYN